MTMELLQSVLKDITLAALIAAQKSSFGIDGLKSAVAFFDPRKDQLITSVDSFPRAVDALGQLAAVREYYGAPQATRLAIQFVFNACGNAAGGLPHEDAFERTWANFAQELSTPVWVFKVVGNLQNIECAAAPLDLGQGVSIRGRSFEELSTLLNWGDYELEELTKDWMAGANSSYVMLIEKEVPKSPANIINASDGCEYPRAAQALLAMRLHGPGDVRLGRLFAARPAAFNVGLGGLSSQGFTHWHPGPPFRLGPEDVPTITRTCQDLQKLEAQGSDSNRNLLLALRSFSSLYDRLFHQADDRVVDAITALEALWKLDVELSFRLAFRTASLLATSDDDRIAIYETLVEYYKIRSKVVHGGSLNDVQSQRLHNDEPLRSIVRRTLKAFLHLAVNPGDWTLNRVDREADKALLHDAGRRALQAAMGLRPPILGTGQMS